MKIATWNVNSLRVRLPHLLDWLAAHAPDAVCLQETKCEDAGFPSAQLEAAGYSSVHNGQRAYNGVAILARSPCSDACRGMPRFED
ncbi:MAG TPA: endonuclease/exonuclease/phosphatase family protein, partial [Myxococcota bacterium]|nr:endonuclease/exonuclease/phosphatase family protein [Myxococcota bacterium]